jgi:hypothetical protein
MITQSPITQPGAYPIFSHHQRFGSLPFDEILHLQTKMPVVGQFEFALKGHAFEPCLTAAKSIAALAAGGTRLSN